MKTYNIKMKDVKLEDIHSVNLVLEPMEGVTIYFDEIIDMKLDFENELTIGTSCIERKVKSGYLKFAFNEKLKRFHGDINITDERARKIKKPCRAKIEERLIRRSDICYLIITYKDNFWTENLDLPFEADENYNMLVGSSSKIDEEGNLVVLFGKDSECCATKS